MREVEIYKYYPDKDREELETIDTSRIRSLGTGSDRFGKSVSYGVDRNGVFGYFQVNRFTNTGKLEDGTRAFLKHRIKHYFAAKKELYEKEGTMK